MGSNFINSEATINSSVNCVNDSILGYAADFSVNGEVDGWEYYDGIHTYGVWNGFLFGTLYTTYGTVGRTSVFAPVDANTHYFVKIAMKYNPTTRAGNHTLPSQAKVQWRTLSNANWGSDKEKAFTLYPDNNWHVYILNMGPEQYWQGDVNDLRIWPAAANGQDGDEFFIRAIEIRAAESYRCKNLACDKYSQYEHPCPWIGARAAATSATHPDDFDFNIEDDSELILNINGYGNEIIKIPEILNGSGVETANALAKAISQVDIGGYAEVRVDYTDNNKFKIYTGTITAESSIVVIDNELSRYLKFYDAEGNYTTSITAGENPASGYSPLSSFKIKTYQALSLFDNNEETNIYFNPFGYSIEGGRRDWQNSSIGLLSASIGTNDGDVSGQVVRTYFTIDNAGKTVIDFNHPFNASGRINKIEVACTLDQSYSKDKNEEERINRELSNAKVLIVRPKRNGQMQVIHEFYIPNRDSNRSYGDELYSLTQEVIDIDVDVFINKGDYLAVYNANMYVGKSISGEEIDAQYYQKSGKVSGVFNPGRLYGSGGGGILVYARSNDTQSRLYLDIDLGARYNLENIEIKGLALNELLEYNIARCLDVNWQADTFGLQHWTYHTKITEPGEFWYQRPNTVYGINNLNDGVYNVPDGLACDSFTRTFDDSPDYYNYNAGPGIIPTNPRYFWVNGDEEWLAIWLHAQFHQASQAVLEFDYDPIAIYVHFPLNKEKTIYKSKIYFKEKYNFRSFALSTYGGPYYSLGDADDVHYDLIPEYTKITLDNTEYEEESPLYDQVSEYLFENPCRGHAITSATSSWVYEWDPVLSEVITDFSNESGYFAYQTATVENDDEWSQARRVDWQILEHQWEPIACKGFRIYTDFHKSTKICEMEIYGVAEDTGSNFAGGITITYSDYQDFWWPTESSQITENLTEVYIGDSPRYLAVDLLPITETRYDDILLNIRTEDVYMGSKGCEYDYYAVHSKINTTNSGQLINIKNNYGAPYDLYVDIAPDTLIEEGLIYYSKLNNAKSITDPTVGPDGIYYKLLDYRIKNRDYNCAINCRTYGIRNLIDSKKAYYSYDDMFTWQEFGTLSHGDSIDFENLSNVSRTILEIPTLSRSRYWKFGLLNSEMSLNIREMRVYDDDGNQLLPDLYHDQNKTFIEGGASYDAPHLANGSITGSYYTIAEDQYITMDFGSPTLPKRIELFNDGMLDYTYITQGNANPSIYAGIDKYTKLCIRPWRDLSGGLFVHDVSYYENPITLHGSTTVVDNKETISYYTDFTCDYMSDWDSITTNGSTFSGTCSSGTGSVIYSIESGNASHDRFTYDFRTGDNIAYKFWQHLPFTLQFKFRLNSWQDRVYHGYDDPSIVVGVLGDKVSIVSAECYLPFYDGPQMYFNPDEGCIGVAVRQSDARAKGEERVSGAGGNLGNIAYSQETGVFNTGTDYYCRLRNLGSNNYRDDATITYRAEVWTDAFGGSNRIVNLTLNTDYFWDAYQIAIASNAYDTPINGTAYECGETLSNFTGILSDLTFTIDSQINGHPWHADGGYSEEYERASLRIPAGSANYVSIPVDNHTNLDLGEQRHTFDFWVKFNSLPGSGQRHIIAENWDYSDSNNRAWRLSIYNHTSAGMYRFEYWLDNGLRERNGQEVTGQYYVPYSRLEVGRWYYLVFSSGKQNTTQGFNQNGFLDINGRCQYDEAYVANPSIIYDVPKGPGINLGPDDFDGWIAEFRISRGDDETINTSTGKGGNRVRQSGSGDLLRYTNGGMLPVPLKPYTRMYPFSFYVSDDNTFFGHYANVDAMFEIENLTYLPYLYYGDSNVFNQNYNAYLAIDLSHSHDLAIVRSYGNSDKFEYSLDGDGDRATNMVFSSLDVDDPKEAFVSTVSFDPDDSFYGFDYEGVNETKWYVGNNVKSHEGDRLRMRNGHLEIITDSDISNIRFYSTYELRGDYDVEIKCGKTNSTQALYNWFTIFRTDFPDSSGGTNHVNVRFAYSSDLGSPYYGIQALVYDDGSLIVNEHTHSINSNNTGMRIIREKNHIYMLYYNGSSWIEFYETPLDGCVGEDARIQIGQASNTNFPYVKNFVKDFKINHADEIVYRSTYQNARWLGIGMLNGDGTTRTIRKMGVYPDITIQISPNGGNYNHYWDSLGPAITAYSTGTNLALGATISGSSFLGFYAPTNATNGIIDDALRNAWLSTNASTQWLLIDLGEEKEIYRIKIYHGYSTEDDNFLAEDYLVQTSLDAQSFTTIFNITNNNSFTRTHDLTDPVTTRYVRIYISNYRSDWMDIRDETTGDYFYWEGTALREVEVYEYYGYSIINSEEYPIIAINLRDQFYLSGDHALIGIDAEDTSTDWSNNNSNFGYSDSIFDDPSKVDFKEFGSTPNYEQWMIIQRNTATNYNSGPHYLKNVILSTTEQLNPIDYWWWWESNLSTISRDFDKEVELCTSSLRIDYPASTALDTVSFIEGSHWGIDSDMALRDGLAFRFYIDNINNLDFENGYFYFGGSDGAPREQSIVYKWYFSTLSGSLQSGWNRPFLRFKTADDVIYTEPDDEFVVPNPLMTEYTQWHTAGITFKGKGQPLVLNVDGCVIQRNHFGDYSKFDQGLYLEGSDYMTCPLAAVDFSSGTIEFWLRPDYTLAGLDQFYRFKNRSLFHFTNVTNDVFGMMITSYGVVVYYGNLAEDLRALTIEGLTAKAIDSLFHVGIVFSNNGLHLDTDNSTIKLYIDNFLVATDYTTWDISDNKSFKFTLGGKPPLGLIEHSSSLIMSSVDGVISNLRIYNYCKTDFTDTIASEEEIARIDDLLLPSEMIEISKDNVTFYKVGDAALPLFFNQVPDDSIIPVYVRTVLPKNLTGKESRTSRLSVIWDVGV